MMVDPLEAIAGIKTKSKPTPKLASNNSRLIEVPRNIMPLLHLPVRKPIAQVPKPVPPVPVKCVLVVLAPHRLQHVKEVHTTAWMKRHDGSVLLAHLEPGPAGRCPCRPRHELRNVLIVVVHGRATWHDGADVLCLYLLEHADNVLGDMLAECEDGAVAYGGVGAQES